MTIAEWRALVRADMAANQGYVKSRFVLRQFRFAQLWGSRRGALARIAYVTVAAVYKLTCEWLLGIEIPPTTTVGPGLRLRHGVGLVVNPRAVIGANVLLRHGVTIGNRREKTDCPVIEDDVEVAAGATIVGAITVGSGTRIGPAAVVTEDVEPGSLVFAPRPVVKPPKA